MAKRVTAVHHAQHVLALVAEILGERQRQIGRLPPHQRRLVGGRDHHHRAREPLLAEVVLHEFLHLAAALADQADHRDVASTLRASIDSSTDLPTPEPAKMPMRWPGSRWEGVERAHAEIERRADPLARMRGGGGAAERIGRRPCGSGPLPSIGSPIALTTRPSQAADGAAPHAFESGERHHHRIVAGEADHLAGNETAVPVSITMRAPTDIAWIGPATSTIRPRTPTTRP
jgi:hypothetical protein